MGKASLNIVGQVKFTFFDRAKFAGKFIPGRNFQVYRLLAHTTAISTSDYNTEKKRPTGRYEVEIRRRGATLEKLSLPPAGDRFVNVARTIGSGTANVTSRAGSAEHLLRLGLFFLLTRLKPFVVVDAA